MAGRARQRFYYTPQGTLVKGLHYDWFTALELPFSEEPFAAPEYLARFGFLVDPQQKASDQPRQPAGGLQPAPRREDRHPLPGHHLRRLPHRRTALPGQVAHRRRRRHALHRRHRADPARRRLRPGARREHGATYYNPFKFNRFARKVLGERYEQTQVATARRLQGRARHPSCAPPGTTPAATSTPPRKAPHRRFRAHRQQRLRRCHRPGNYRVANAPVSYPQVWDIWKFDWCNGTARPCSRWRATSARPSASGAPADLRRARPAAAGRALRLQRTPARPARPGRNLQQLKPPTWPEDLFGRIDRNAPPRATPCSKPTALPCTRVQPAEYAAPDAIPSGACTWCRPR